MKTNILLTLLLSSLFSLSLFARENAIAPENKLWISADSKEAGGITREEYDSVINKLNTIYGPIVAALGAELYFDRSWDDGTVNAYADRLDTGWLVSLCGGMARYKIMTPDAFALVTCHELSHHLGGAPRYTRQTTWAASEGQADYIGTMKCMKEYFKDENNTEVVKKLQVEASVKEKCEKVYSSPEEAAICIRTALAGKTLATVLGELADESKAPSFSTPDQNITSRTIEYHPQAQCRLDTFLAGALCKKNLSEPPHYRDVLQGTCNSSQGDLLGVRPLCWFKP